MAMHMCKRFIVEVEPNQAIMPINVPPPSALKNVSNDYNDGGFSYSGETRAEEKEDYEPGIRSMIEPNCTCPDTLFGDVPYILPTHDSRLPSRDRAP